MSIVKGDRVKVAVSQERLVEMDYIDPESYYYVKDFMGKRGQVFDITTSDSGHTSYHVNFGGQIGMFYQDEVTLIQY